MRIDGNPKGESIAKDTQVLLKLFQNEETIRAHIADLFAIVKKNRFDGLEIDYENLWKDPVVARNFMHFLEILVPMAMEEMLRAKMWSVGLPMPEPSLHGRGRRWIMGWMEFPSGGWAAIIK